MTQSADATSRREEEGESLPPSLPTCDLRRQRERRPGPEEVGGMGPPHSRCPLAKVKGMRLEPGLNTPHRRRGSKQAHTATVSRGAQIATIVRSQVMPIVFGRPTVQTRDSRLERGHVTHVMCAGRSSTRWISLPLHWNGRRGGSRCQRVRRGAAAVWRISDRVAHSVVFAVSAHFIKPSRRGRATGKNKRRKTDE